MSTVAHQPSSLQRVRVYGVSKPSADRKKIASIFAMACGALVLVLLAFCLGRNQGDANMAVANASNRNTCTTASNSGILSVFKSHSVECKIVERAESDIGSDALLLSVTVVGSPANIAVVTQDGQGDTRSNHISKDEMATGRFTKFANLPNLERGKWTVVVRNEDSGSVLLQTEMSLSDSQMQNPEVQRLLLNAERTKMSQYAHRR